MDADRDENGILRGDLQYDVGFPATIRSDIVPVFYPCPKCGTLTLHVVVEQPTGLAIKIPFMRKPLASTGKDYGLICNDCTATAGISGKPFADKLMNRVVPAEICRAIDTFCADQPGAAKAYTEAFAKFFLPLIDGDASYVATCLAVYRREA